MLHWAVTVLPFCYLNFSGCNYLKMLHLAQAEKKNKETVIENELAWDKIVNLRFISPSKVNSSVSGDYC